MIEASPERELLLLCARPQLDAAAARRVRALFQQKPDWLLLLSLAEDYRTIPLLALHVRRHAADLLSENMLEELQAHHLNSTRHNLVLAAELVRMMDLFARAGIEVTPFKGPVSAMLAYGDMAMRACGDIDLLVGVADHRAAERLLEREGYSVSARYENALQSCLRHAQRGVEIDLHWGLPPAALGLNAQPFRQRLEPVMLLGREVPTFCPRDTLLITAINAVKEYWKPSLHHLSDIATLTDRYSDEDWRTAFRRARETGCERMLAAAVLFAHRVLETALPSCGSERLFRHPGINRVVDELEAHLFGKNDEQAGDEGSLKPVHHRQTQSYYLTLTDSPWRRARDWWRWAMTPGSADQAALSLPRNLSFLYYLVRPLRLLLKRL